jgi:excisionase family DNA binding protein
MVWITKQEAAVRLGVHVATIDRKLKRGELNAKRESTQQGWRWLVELPEDDSLTEASSSPTDNAGPAPAGADAADLALFWQLVDTLRDEVALLQQELEHRAQEMERLHILLQQALDPTRAIAASRQTPWWRRLWQRE